MDSLLLCKEEAVAVRLGEGDFCLSFAVINRKTNRFLRELRYTVDVVYRIN